MTDDELREVLRDLMDTQLQEEILELGDIAPHTYDSVLDVCVSVAVGFVGFLMDGGEA